MIAAGSRVITEEGKPGVVVSLHQDDEAQVALIRLDQSVRVPSKRSHFVRLPRNSRHLCAPIDSLRLEGGSP